MSAAETGARSVIIVSPDAAVRIRLRATLTDMRWNVLEAAGGAEAMQHLDRGEPEALMLDQWLPDLEITAFTQQVQQLYPTVDLLSLDGTPTNSTARSSRRNELLHALRQMEPVAASDTAAWNAAPAIAPRGLSIAAVEEHASTEPVMLLPGIAGNSEAMHQLAASIRLVAPSHATVLIEGDTGTGKELVAQAVHTLSPRSAKPFVTLNCAAIPESLLEAELFGHTRGAFTGAVQSRTGRVEAANGGTLFLDEIGEMPLALQAKILRFLESGELQRVGENDSIRVDVRVVAATHQPLEQRSEEHSFRLDLYHRLAVFPVWLAPLRDRMDDLPMLVEYFLSRRNASEPVKRILQSALELLATHSWPGNVRELLHVLERAAILSGTSPEIGPPHIRFGGRLRVS